MQQLEALEPRRQFSVTVTEGYPGYYEIHGTDADDLIAASVSMANETFTMDGTTYTSVAYIFVHGGDGNDEIILYSEDGSGSIAASISAGGGHDIASLNFDGALWAGSGDDTIYLNDSFRGQADGGNGSDQMHIIGANIDAEIRGGHGDDYIDCSANDDAAIIRGGPGNDSLYGSRYADQIYGDEGEDYLHGGGGDDAFYAQDGYPDQVVGADGYDFVYADTTETSIVSAEEIYF